MWKYQHKLQNERYNAGKKPLPLSPAHTQRLDNEFEAALEQRGQRAKAHFEATTANDDKVVS